MEQWYWVESTSHRLHPIRKIILYFFGLEPKAEERKKETEEDIYS